MKPLCQPTASHTRWISAAVLPILFCLGLSACQHNLWEPQENAGPSWQLKGKLGYRKTEGTRTLGGSASLRWQQNGHQYHIVLSGPLGAGAIAITGNPQQVTVNDGKQTFTADDPESVAEHLLGVAIPVRFLRYWVRATPAPETPFKLQRNAEGLPGTLKQEGWQLVFSQYDPQNRLPRKIVATREGTRIILVIHQWH